MKKKNFNKKILELNIPDLTKEEILELKKLADEMTIEAQAVSDDYEKNPAETSGSFIEIHEDSPYLEDKFPGKLWEDMKKVGNQYIFSPKNKPKVDSNGLIIESGSEDA